MMFNLAEIVVVVGSNLAKRHRTKMEITRHVEFRISLELMVTFAFLQNRLMRNHYGTQILRVSIFLVGMVKVRLYNVPYIIKQEIVLYNYIYNIV